MTWKVKASDNELGPGSVSAVEYTPDQGNTGTISFTGINVGDKLNNWTTLTAKQVIAADADTATLKVTGQWGDYFKGSTFTESKKSREICKDQPPHSTPPSSTPPSSAPASSAPASSAPASSAPASSAPASSAPASSAPASSAPASSAVPSNSATTTPENPVLTEPQFVYDATCDTFTVGVEVPADWKESLTVTFKPSTGDSKTVTAAPGETKTVDFPASKGLKVTATPKGYEDEAGTIAYTAPADCDQLALTGSNSSTIAGGAVLVLLIGAGLFFMARRRKVRFTA
ncbi:LAETG motif-containing sortase-dependent surface protein [Actinoplanes sp. HUAS TT8]|uniref:LAETG motif-containing sortase-dependent surface protein n=1 Tax=Actinoplanes sp. HUAS TT8 TaxID=3447453 RepID=UPI003F520C35